MSLLFGDLLKRLSERHSTRITNATAGIVMGMVTEFDEAIVLKLASGSCKNTNRGHHENCTVYMPAIRKAQRDHRGNHLSTEQHHGRMDTSPFRRER
jgi:hypothetical protein